LVFIKSHPWYFLNSPLACLEEKYTRRKALPVTSFCHKEGKTTDGN